MDFECKKVPDQKLAVINYKGPITDMDVLVSKLLGWAESEEIKIESEPFIIYYSPRHSVNEGDAVYDVGIVIDNEEEPERNDLIRVVDLFEHEVLSALHKGSTDNILETYEKVVEYSQENNYDIIGSPKEILHKSLYNCDDESEYITEIQLPIIKM